MPLSFIAFPALTLEEARVARGHHRVDVSGAASVLITFVPELAASAAPNGDGHYLLDLSVVYWLLLPPLTLGADVPAIVPLADVMVDPARCGIALERLLLAGLDASPCELTVARKRIKDHAASVRLIDPASFQVGFNDLYMVETAVPVRREVLGRRRPRSSR